MGVAAIGCGGKFSALSSDGSNTRDHKGRSIAAATGLRKALPEARIPANDRSPYEDRKAQTGTVDNPISLDELAALDADNKRLKRLLG